MEQVELEKIVRAVLSEMSANKKENNYARTNRSVIEVQPGDGVFEDVHEAIEAAKKSQKQLRDMPLEFREKIIAKIREKIMENKEILAEMGVEETGMGRVGHKILKHELVAKKTPGTEAIKVEAWAGDQGLTLIEKGPFGVVGAVTPSTNPSETILCNSIGMIAAGNTVVFNAHPGAKNVSNYAVQLVNQASKEVGGIDNLAVSVLNPTMDTGNVIFSHPEINLLVATGGPGVVKAVLSSGKKGIAAGAGNPPVLVDETANIRKAAEDIINGASFDNNLPCISEKEVIVVEQVADELIHYMVGENDCYMLTDQRLIDRLAEIVLVDKNGKKVISRDYVGKDADYILRALGIEASPNTKCIIFEGTKDNILIRTELMMPILGIVRVKDVDEGIKVAKELEGGNHHSAHMHSTNVLNLTKYGRELDTAIFVKNAPSYAGLGFGGEGFTTFTIASRTGEGLTNALSFTKQRRCVLSDSFYIR